MQVFDDTSRGSYGQEWFVRQVTVERHEKVYACCPEPYPDVTLFVTSCNVMLDV